MQRLERYFILQFCKSSSCNRVNQARVALFKTGTRMLDKIPSTQDALFQHVKRALLQAGYIWKQALQRNPILPPFTEWGWKRNTAGLFTPLWSLLPDTSQTCSLLIHCYCRVSCSGNCKCARAGLNCTSLCRYVRLRSEKKILLRENVAPKVVHGNFLIYGAFLIYRILMSSLDDVRCNPYLNISLYVYHCALI